jgi:hypothetical protein
LLGVSGHCPRVCSAAHDLIGDVARLSDGPSNAAVTRPPLVFGTMIVSTNGAAHDLIGVLARPADAFPPELQVLHRRS